LYPTSGRKHPNGASIHDTHLGRPRFIRRDSARRKRRGAALLDPPNKQSWRRTQPPRLRSEPDGANAGAGKNQTGHGGTRGTRDLRLRPATCHRPLGIAFGEDDAYADGLLIESVTAGTAAARIGVTAGARMISIGGVSATDRAAAEAAVADARAGAGHVRGSSV
jgi:hypothetical protein